MSSAAGSIPLMATVYAQRSAAVVLSARRSKAPPARASAPRSRSVAPVARRSLPPASQPVARVEAEQADYVLTAVAFRPDGRRAMTLRVGVRHCIALGLLVGLAVCAALASGWVLGEWTARL